MVTKLGPLRKVKLLKNGRDKLVVCSPEKAGVGADFIVRQRYGVSDQIQHTWMFRHPRRTCEALAAATLQNSPLPNNPYPTFTSVQELQEWVSPLVAEEVEYEKNGAPFSARVPLGR
jgi:hypothetical protein